MNQNNLKYASFSFIPNLEKLVSKKRIQKKINSKLIWQNCVLNACVSFPSVIKRVKKHCFRALLLLQIFMRYQAARKRRNLGIVVRFYAFTGASTGPKCQRGAVPYRPPILPSSLMARHDQQPSLHGSLCNLGNKGAQDIGIKPAELLVGSNCTMARLRPSTDRFSK